MSILSEILSYVVLLGVSLYGMMEYCKKPQPVPFLYGTFLITGAYAVLGLVKSGCDNCDNVKQLREILQFLIPVISLPCVISEVWAKNKVVQENFVWIHLGAGALMTGLHYGYQNISKEIFDLAVGLNSLSLIGVALSYEEYYTALAGMFFIMAQYGAHRSDLHFDINLPPEELYNYCLAGYALCAALSTCHGTHPF